MVFIECDLIFCPVSMLQDDLKRVYATQLILTTREPVKFDLTIRKITLLFISNVIRDTYGYDLAA